MLAKLITQIENEWAICERKRLLILGQNKAPRMTREEIVSIAQITWRCIDHMTVAGKGLQTDRFH